MLPIFACFPRGRAFVFAKKDPPGINSNIRGVFYFIFLRSPRDNSAFYMPISANFFGGGELKEGGELRGYYSIYSS